MKYNEAISEIITFTSKQIGKCDDGFDREKMRDVLKILIQIRFDNASENVFK